MGIIRWLRIRGAKATYAEAQAARLNPALPGFLGDYYGRELLRRGGLAYPVFAARCPAARQDKLESILGELRTAARYDFVESDEAYLRLLRRQGKDLYNGRTYTMESFTEGEEHKLRCGLGYYFDAMKTCDSLEWEILTAIGARGGPAADFTGLRRCLRRRSRYLKRVPDPVHDGTGRSAALSISTLVVFNTGATHQALIRQRSRRTAAHGDLYHVVPSFMFQPAWGDAQREFSIRHNVYREYLEEIFGVEDMEKSTGEVTCDWFYEHEKLRELMALLQTGAADLLLTGYAMNMLNLRPEICTLLLIRDPHWAKQRMHVNWEFLTPAQSDEQRQEPARPVDIVREDGAIAAELSSIPGTFVPPGAAAFWLGVDVARERLARQAAPPRRPASGDQPLVFVSAKSADYPHARQVRQFLQAHAVRVFFSEESLPERKDSDYRRQVDAAIEEADHMVVVVSRPEHARSPWVQAEWGSFENERRSGRKAGNLITVAATPLDPHQLPLALRNHQVISLDRLEELIRYVCQKSP